MRTIVAIVAALLGGYLLWKGIRIGRVLLILDDTRADTTLLIVAGVLCALGGGLLYLAYRFFRPQRATPLPPRTPPTP